MIGTIHGSCRTNTNYMAMKFDKKKVTAVVWEIKVTVMNNFGEEREFRTENINFHAAVDKMYAFRNIINQTYEFKEPEPEELTEF